MQDFRQAAILYLFTLATADVMIYSQKTHRQIEIEFRDLSSTFGESIPVEGIRAFLVYSNPANACSAIAPPPNITNFTERWAVLIQRWDCNYATKVRNAQNASYDIAIVHNVNSTEIVRMTAVDPSGIFIPSIFISGPAGVFLKEEYQYSKGYYIIVDDDSPFVITIHLLLPFAIVVGICSTAMIGFMICKCIKERRRAQRHRLPNSSLQKIPTALFRRGDPYETCAVCLEDFVEGEKLRILPCSHAYHCSCIDPWLTRSRRVCPMCKRKVFTGCESCVASDSESGSEEDDNTPLLRSSQPRGGQGGGTFNTVDENPFLIAFLRDPFIVSSLANDDPANRTSPLPSTSRFLVRSVNAQDESSDYSSVESYSSVYTSAVDTNNQNLVNSNANVPGNNGEGEGYRRSPSRNVLIGSREEVNGDRSDVTIS